MERVKGTAARADYLGMFASDIGIVARIVRRALTRPRVPVPVVRTLGINGACLIVSDPTRYVSVR